MWLLHYPSRSLDIRVDNFLEHTAGFRHLTMTAFLESPHSANHQPHSVIIITIFLAPMSSILM